MTTSFESLGLRPELVQTVLELGFTSPTPIQEAAIPPLLAGRDVLGQAQTGTGKTAAFALPMLNALMQREGTGVRALVLTPTRELALQVSEAIVQFGQAMRAKVVAIYGGSSYTRQLRQLENGAQIVVGTPGRLIDLMERGALKLGNVEYVALDEADEMLKMGFSEDVERIMKATPASRQTSLFSATLPDGVQQLARKYMRDALRVATETRALTVPQTEQRYYLVDEDAKLAAVSRLLETEDWTSALIFVRTKLGAAHLADALMARDYPVEALHGDLSQDAREAALRRFRRGQVMALVATDVMARGLDIQGVSHVFNYDMPSDAEDYVHRIGRTGRAGREGVAISLVTPRERRWLKAVEGYISRAIPKATLPRPEHVLQRRDQKFAQRVIEMLNEEELVNERAWVEALAADGVDMTAIAAAAVRMARASDSRRPIENISEATDRGMRPEGRSGSGSRERNGGHRRPEGERSFSPSTTGEEGRRSRTEREAGMVRLMINVGRADGIMPGDIVGAIASEAGIPGRAIGAIDIRKHETYVDVNEQHVEKVLARMKRGMMRGQPVELTRAAE